MPHESAAGDGLSVQYTLDVEGGLRIDEADSMLRFDEYASSIQAAQYCEGAIVLKAPGQEPLNLNDALPSLITHLCFRSLEKLRINETVTVPFFMSGNDVVASIQGRELWLNLTLGGTFHYEKQALMRALFECGLRFSNFYARLWAANPLFEGDLANLKQDSVLAKNLLALEGG